MNYNKLLFLNEKNLLRKYCRTKRTKLNMFRLSNTERNSLLKVKNSRKNALTFKLRTKWNEEMPT